ncbi:protein FAM177A1 isoform X2 [Myxocyprinus asiaticus]|uniref:protein FAM177A1 isoform X2 n=1 Tax=Myxocyprinus asiaticus TaxID=70543 RepID=UPI0022226B29|nr:protein FAM177A1 isoform X2 [Myxocyprinus asiaticus]
MAGISIYVASVNITVSHDMDTEKSSGKEKEYECVELGDLERKEKTPRRIIHFSSGEIMEEYSTDDEEENKKENTKKDLLSSKDTMWKAAASTMSACDYLGERMASLFGITTAKYQYAIDEYSRAKKEEDKDEDTQLSEEAEHLFVEQNEEDEEPKTNQPKTKSTQRNVTNELDLHSSLVPNTVHIPALVTSP